MLIKFLFLALIANAVYCCIESSSTLNKINENSKENKKNDIINDGKNDKKDDTEKISVRVSNSISLTNTDKKKESIDILPSETIEVNKSISILNEIKEKPLICYYGSWAVYRPGDGKFSVEDIDPHVCTHLIYAFAGLSYNNQIVSLDAWNDLPDNYGRNAFGRFTNLKKKNNKLKTMIGIGGWNEGSVKYSNMVKSKESRKKFVESVVNMLEKYNFDGCDVDWEYPANRGGQAADKENYVKLLIELKEAFNPKGFLLTAAVGAGIPIIDSAYDIPMISKHLDYINVMTYDLHGVWDKKTGNNAPLYARSDESGDEARLNVNYAINYWIKKGAPKEKLILGIPAYGKTFTLSNAKQNGYDSPITGPGTAAQYTREPGNMGYNEFCETQLKSSEKWTVVQDNQGKVPYAYKGNQWIGFDDIASVNRKGRYVHENGLAGAMVWSIETDDFRDICGQGKFPLLTSIRKGLENIIVENPDSEEDLTSSTSPTLSSESVSTTSSSQTSDSSSTTTSSPTQTTPQDPDKFNCEKEGFFKSSTDCATFYRCVFVGDFGDGSKYRKFVYHCPAGTVFDDQNDLCVWPSAVKGCEHFYDSTNQI